MIGLKLMWKWKNLSILFTKSLCDENRVAKLRRGSHGLVKYLMHGNRSGNIWEWK
jgi:hypothetical protein